jgi:MerR family Zn(II)-responsive transcriptional regulator of zntA
LILHTLTMRIGELAKEAGISISSVRFYEAQGLMPKPGTRDSGYREYEGSDLERLRLIVSAKRQRFPLKLIRTALDALDQKPEPCGEIAELVRDRITNIGREIRDLQRLQAHLESQLMAWERGTLPKAECLCAILQTNALRGEREGKE